MRKIRILPAAKKKTSRPATSGILSEIQRCAVGSGAGTVETVPGRTSAVADTEFGAVALILQ